MLTVGSCFSGIGGLELGLEWTGGFKTKWQIELDPYASKVLAKHWPHVQRFQDITAVANPPRVDVICGGFPCQDVSLAGARAGLEGKRSTLWGEMFRLVCEARPRWVLAENVPGLLSSDGGRFFGNILRDLASGGYDVAWGVLSAAGVGAPHLRRRIFIVAHSPVIRREQIGAREPSASSEISNATALLGQRIQRGQQDGILSGVLANPKSEQDGGKEQSRIQPNARTGRKVANTIGVDPRTTLGTKDRRSGQRVAQDGHQIRVDAGNSSQDVAHTNRKAKGRLSSRTQKTFARAGIDGKVRHASSQRLSHGIDQEVRGSESLPESQRSDWWAIEPNVGRVAYGIPRRVDRLKCLGNAVVPQVAQKIGEMILAWESKFEN